MPDSELTLGTAWKGMHSFYPLIS